MREGIIHLIFLDFAKILEARGFLKENFTIEELFKCVDELKAKSQFQELWDE